MGKANNLDLAKFRSEVENELNASVDGQKTGTVIGYFDICIVQLICIIYTTCYFARIIISDPQPMVTSDDATDNSDVQGVDSTQQRDENTSDPDKTYDGDSFEGDGLPDIEDKDSKLLPFQNDHIISDDAATETMDSDGEPLVPQLHTLLCKSGRGSCSSTTHF